MISAQEMTFDSHLTRIDPRQIARYETGYWEAYYHRARAMLYSDRWVRQGHLSGSPLLLQVEAELSKAYAAVRSLPQRGGWR